MNDIENIRLELGERSYDIIFNSADSIECLAAFAALPQKNVLLVADSNTAVYADRVSRALEKSGKRVSRWVFPAGESSKNIENAMKLCGHAAALNFGRNSLFAALGGGVTGDLTGFAASIYMRGIDFIQIPTSLLAMVDSSVGGKTAVDTVHGKNLVGAFHQPKLVVMDMDMLASLPNKERGNGMAEIIKTAMIKDRDFAEYLKNTTDTEFDLMKKSIRRSCEIKASVVSEDEKESGVSGRVFLNYGHTFGHALEHLSGFRLAHGEAVAAGMDIAAFAAAELGLCGKDVQHYQNELLHRYHIAPADIPFSQIKREPEKIVAMMKGDKKNGDGCFRAVLPIAVGEVKTVSLDPQWTEDMLHRYFASCCSRREEHENRKEVAVIGLGLLGSSLALSFDHNKFLVKVWNRNIEACRWAMEKQAAEGVYDSVEEAFSSADIVVLALPIPITQEFIRRYHRFQKSGAVATDIASVKGLIMAEAEKYPEFDFVGSHPMAGTEKSGWQAGFAGLYDNADIFVVAGKNSSEKGIADVENMWSSLGNTHVRRSDAATHDALVAHTSHALHIIASSLTRAILEREDAVEQKRHYSGCATGFRDTSRIASSSPEMWKEICMANKDAIVPALKDFQRCFSEMTQSMISGNADKFAELFLEGRHLRDSWLCYKNSGNLPENLILCGIKHSGKSSTGREIAEILDIPFTDIDDEIVRQDADHRSVREIFSCEGEEKFRKLEAETLERVLKNPRRQVIALGGGLLSNPFVADDVKRDMGCKIFLDADDASAFARIRETGLPPFLAGEKDPLAAFAAMNGERRKIFEKFADIKVVPHGTAHRTALHILSLYKDKYF